VGLEGCSRLNEYMSYPYLIFLLLLSPTLSGQGLVFLSVLSSSYFLINGAVLLL
jgi:hypothetical protein